MSIGDAIHMLGNYLEICQIKESMMSDTVFSYNACTVYAQDYW